MPGTEARRGERSVGHGVGIHGGLLRPVPDLPVEDEDPDDPEGEVEEAESDERAEDLPKILDGDDSTYWQSQGYQNATFSGLKPGIGVVLDLGEPSTISEVTLELPIAAKGSIYVTDDDAYADTRPAIKTDMERAGAFSGEGSVSVELAAGTEGRYVIVWFTEVSRSGEWYRARLAGASATS